MSKINRGDLLALLQNAKPAEPCKGSAVAPAKAKKVKTKLSSEEAIPDDYFDGKKVVFTGTLIEMTREVASGYVEQLGGTTSKTMTKDTDALVVAAEVIESGKLDKAKKLGIKIINELDFMRILESNALIPVSI